MLDKLKIILLCCLFVSNCTTSSDDLDPETFTVGGELTGNTGDITLSLNGTSENFTGSAFTFSQRLELGDPYTVLFESSVDDITCDIVNGNGIISGNVNNLSAICSPEETSNIISFEHTAITGNLTSGDFNGDDHLDLAMSVRTLSTHPDGGDLWPVRFMLGNGNGNFVDGFDITMFHDPSSNKVGRYFLALDFDQDGIDDFANSNQSALEVFKGMSNDSPARISNTNSYAGEPIDYLYANGDSFPDIVSMVAGGSQSNFFGIYQYQDGNIAEPTYAGHRDDDDIRNLRIGSPLNFTTGEFNGDNSDDILSIVQTQNESGENGIGIALFSGNGDGSFENPNEMLRLPNDLFLGSIYFDHVAREIGSGDFDGDGDLDIALMASSNFIRVFLNNGAGTFSGGDAYDVGNQPIHIKVADFNLDGDMDIFTLNAESRDFSLLYGVGDGSFTQATNIPIHNNAELYDVTIGHFDDNNYTDIAIAESITRQTDTGRGAIFLYFNPGLED